MSKVTYYVETWRWYGEAESISRFCVTAPDIDKDFENVIPLLKRAIFYIENVEE